MPKQEDALRGDDGALLDGVPEYIRNLSEPAPDESGADAGDEPRDDLSDHGGAGAGPLSRARERTGAGLARVGAGVRRAGTASAGGIGRAGRSARAALPTSTKGRAILVSGTAVVAAGVVVGVLAVQAYQRDENLRAAPGGVLTLEEAAHEAWAVDLDGAVQPRITPVAGLAAVTAGGSVLGLDPVTGVERWSVEVLDDDAVAEGAQLRCGPSLRTVGSVAVRAAPSSAPLVCVTEDGAAREAVVIGADGAVERRALEPAGDAGSATVHAPLPGGGLAVIARDEGRVDLGDAQVLEDDDGVAWVKGTIASAPGVTIQVEDAATGDVRWGPVTVDFDAAADESSCLTWGDDGPEIEVLNDFTWSADEAEISVAACGIAARLVTADGGPVPDVELEDRVRTPWATDDPELDPALVPEREDTADVLAQTADVAVVLTVEGQVEAYDVKTGDTRWTADVLGADAAAVAGSAVFGAYTDGRSVLLVVDGPSTGGSGQLRLVALDLGSGATTWDEDQGEPYAQIAAVDGNLVQITGTGVAGLATSPER
ncbi:hypothetical protein GCM10028784_35150 [Myceligenerans cantabricum]